MRIVVTGGLGFIGSHVVRRFLREPDVTVENVDVLTYAGNPANLADVENHPRYRWHRVSITDAPAIDAILSASPVDAIVHLAAESHVDRSIESGMPFVETNVLGTQTLLESARRHGVGRFVHVSTDEVYGSLGPTGLFTEETPVGPRSPYSASKAGSDLLALAAHHTYAQDVVITRCSNNYGPYQFPEKLIPLWITNGLEGKPWPIYGDGLNVRDWLYVEDHAEALWLALTRGRAGEVYNIGGRNERSNRQVADDLLRLMDLPPSTVVPVADRLGHDRRYAIDPTRAEKELGFIPAVTWSEGLGRTLAWYRENRPWWEAIKTGAYQEFYRRRYQQLEETPHEP